MSLFWLGTSWKMNKDSAQAREAARALRDAPAWPDHIQPFVIPPFTSLEAVTGELRNTRILTGAQNVHWDDAGAWTGEISAPMIRSCGATLVEIGHSERRTHFAETDETVNRKVHATLRNGLTPLICIGETASQRDGGVAFETLAIQTKLALQGLSNEQAANVLIAYEPVWAIGAQGRAADPDIVRAAFQAIRGTLTQIHPTLATIPLLYGGSVDGTNATAYAALPETNGLFIGRAAWSPDGLIRIAAAVGALTRS
jgi:triosephosphate isomerase